MCVAFAQDSTYGAAPTALGIIGIIPQPCRAGLTFGGRPSGPRLFFAASAFRLPA